MPKLRFVLPDTTRLPLSDGDWVEITTRLTYAEQQHLSSSMLRTVRTEDGSQEIGLDMAKYNLLRLNTYLTDWSFRDQADKPVEVSRAAIEHLDPDAAAEIERALDAHIEAQTKKEPSPVTTTAS